MRDKRRAIKDRGRGDPGIGSFQAPASSASCDHHFGPFEDQTREDGTITNLPRNARSQSIRLLCQFDRSAHCSNSASVIKEISQLPVAELWQISWGPAVALEEKRNGVRVQDDRLHAAGSVLVWPRHSRSAARKSSIDSSSGQKSPRSSRGSRGNATCCSAISSSIVGCPSGTYFSPNDIDNSSLARTSLLLNSVRQSWYPGLAVVGALVLAASKAPLLNSGMFARCLGTVLLLGASTLLCLAEDSPRPTCNSENTGKMWPDAANHDRKALVRLARCGELQMCVRSGKKFRWELLTVRIDQLRGGSKLDQPSGCETSPGTGNYPDASASKAAQ